LTIDLLARRKSETEFSQGVFRYRIEEDNHTEQCTASK